MEPMGKPRSFRWLVRVLAWLLALGVLAPGLLSLPQLDPNKQVGAPRSLHAQANLPIWVEATPQDAPPANEYPRWSMVYDSVRGRAVMLGIGFFSTGTWEYDGAAWQQVETSEVPTGLLYYVMTYDSARQRVVLFGVDGIDTHTWEYDGATWMETTPVASPLVGYYGITYDSARRRVVLFGGGATLTYGFTPNSELPELDMDLPNSTWEYDGASWERVDTPFAPAGRLYHAMTYDSNRQRVVLFGGLADGGLSDTWEYDGSTWQETTPPNSPVGRAFHALAYDSAHRKVVLYGGISGDGDHIFNDTWEYDGANWVETTPANSPGERVLPTLAYDSARRRVVLFGGISTDPTIESTFLVDTWEYISNNDVPPAQATSTSPRTANAYSISGRVLDVLDKPVAGVTVSDDTGHIALTDADGKYELSGLPPGQYRPELSKDGYTFGLRENGPDSRIVPISNSNVDGQDYTGYDKPPIIFVHGWHGMWKRPSNYIGRDLNCDWPETINDFEVADDYLKLGGYYVEYARLEATQCSVPRYEENATRLRNTITLVKARTGQPKVILVAHSMGGLVSRAYIESKDFLDDGKPVSQLFTFGTPHNGVPIAFILPRVPYFCALQPGACNFMPTPMKVFNRKYHPRTTDVKYHLIGGDVPRADKQGLARLNIYPPNDGIVPADSSLGKADLSGSLDRYKTDEAHGDGLGKYPYFALRDEDPSKSYTDCLKPVLIDGRSNCGSQGSSSDILGALLPLTLKDASASPLEVQAQTQSAYAPFEYGMLTQGQTATRDVIIGGGQAVLAAQWLGGKVILTLTNPRGQQVDPEFMTSHPELGIYESGDGWAIYSVNAAAAGTWKLTLWAEEAPAEGLQYSTVAAFDSSVSLSASTDRDWYTPGSSAIITANIAGSDDGAEVIARVLRPDRTLDTIALTPQNGIYSASYTIPTSPGYAELRLSAAGIGIDGAPYELGSLATFQIESSVITFTGTYNSMRESCAPGATYNSLKVDVGVRATEGGRIGLAADLVDGAGNAVAHAVTSLEVVPGESNIPLYFGGEDIARSQRNGPYKLTRLLLTDERDSLLVAAEAQDAHIVQDYGYDSFACNGGATIPSTTTADMFEIPGPLSILVFGAAILALLATVGILTGRRRRTLPLTQVPRTVQTGATFTATSPTLPARNLPPSTPPQPPYPQTAAYLPTMPMSSQPPAPTQPITQPQPRPLPPAVPSSQPQSTIPLNTMQLPTPTRNHTSYSRKRVLCPNCGRALNPQTGNCDACGWKESQSVRP
jgi:hypothetical protein